METMEKKKYVKPRCEVFEMETATMLANSPNTLRVDHAPSDECIEGAVNRNNGWDLW